MGFQEFKDKGGAWLGEARKWMQWNCKNGSRVTWGSSDILQKDFTVQDVEEIAAKAAFAEKLPAGQRKLLEMAVRDIEKCMDENSKVCLCNARDNIKAVLDARNSGN